MLAATADLHYRTEMAGLLAPAFADVSERAAALVLAGDLTHRGLPEEAAGLARELQAVTIPVVAILGNHDYHSGRQDEVRSALEAGGIQVLEGDPLVLESGDGVIGLAGVKGFCGGFHRPATEFGEPEMKAFALLARESAECLQAALRSIRSRCDVLVGVTHYAPVPDTLFGEPLEVWPWLGSFLLGKALDDGDADLGVHGHAHVGAHRGSTPGGRPVINVARPLTGLAYCLLELEPRVAAT